MIFAVGSQKTATVLHPSKNRYRGDLETPVSHELQAILASPVRGHVILIDDIRCFDGTHDYPYLDDFLAAIRTDGRYHVEVSADILRMTPN